MAAPEELRIDADRKTLWFITIGASVMLVVFFVLEFMGGYESWEYLGGEARLVRTLRDFEPMWHYALTAAMFAIFLPLFVLCLRCWPPRALLRTEGDRIIVPQLFRTARLSRSEVVDVAVGRLPDGSPRLDLRTAGGRRVSPAMKPDGSDWAEVAIRVERWRSADV